ncbi:MAG TPA: peptide chain release factor N(5)-glutamine methyltransferase [Longimicrobiales bacterium]|nr:peptide chain release factor N(5)-glutamine methyltransferase [Longimicrobiales bacterium]
MAEHALALSRKAADVLAARGVESPRLEAELLVAGLLGIRRLDLYLQHDRPIDGAELERFRAMVRRRLRGEPLQYILGTASFRHLELAVDARVLIPRPETEVLVGAVLEWATSRGRQGAVVDIGTGSGAIALSLAKEGAFARVLATDISAGALEVAAANAVRNDLDGAVEFRRGSLFGALQAGERFDVVVSNPPYIGESERGSLAVEVVAHEPALALFAGPDGLALVGELVTGAPAWLAPGGLLAVEIGAGQGAAVLERVNACGAYAGARIAQDLAGRPRMLVAELAG